jgi:hypothetical protein
MMLFILLPNGNLQCGATLGNIELSSCECELCAMRNLWRIGVRRGSRRTPDPTETLFFASHARNHSYCFSDCSRYQSSASSLVHASGRFGSA